MGNMTRLQAINEMLETINEWPWSFLDSTGTWPTKAYGGSIAGQAERTLDRVCREVLTRGEVDNTQYGTSVVPTGVGPYEYTFASNVLRVRGAGVDIRKSFGIRGGKLLDTDRGTTQFATNAAIYLDVITDYDFTDLSFELQNQIVKEAKQQFQRWQGEDPKKDIQIAQEADIARAANSGNAPAGLKPINPLKGIGPFGAALQAQPKAN